MSRKINVTQNKYRGTDTASSPRWSASMFKYHTFIRYKSLKNRFFKHVSIHSWVHLMHISEENAFSFRFLVHDYVVQDWNQTKSILSSKIGQFFTKISGYTSVYIFFLFQPTLRLKPTFQCSLHIQISQMSAWEKFLSHYLKKLLGKKSDFFYKILNSMLLKNLIQ